MRTWTTLMATITASVLVASPAIAQGSAQERRARGFEQGRDAYSSGPDELNPARDRRMQGRKSPGQRETRQQTPAAEKGAAELERGRRDSMRNDLGQRQRSSENRQTRQPATSRNAQGEQSHQRGQAARPSFRNEARFNERAPNLSSQQRARFASVISRQRVEPATRTNFSLRAGVEVPSTVRLTPVPAEIVEIVPQYRGYDYFVTTDQIVIVEPRTHEIVYLMPYAFGSRTALSSYPHRANLDLTREQEEVILQNAYPIRRATTGSAIEREVVVEEEAPSSIELEEFDEPVLHAIPSIRQYRYYRDDGGVVIVDPRDRRVLDVVR